VGDEPVPDGLEGNRVRGADLLSRWRDAAARRGIEEVERRGWERYVIVTDSHGPPTAIRIARSRPRSVLGVAIGHASLSHATTGERAPMRGGIWEAMAQLARQGNEPFVRYGIAQMTRGGVDEETAQRMVERFPDMDLVSAMVDALGQNPEPIGNALAELDLPLLLAKHEGCLGRTDEGFEDIVNAFPDADTVICPETCASSPTFAGALGSFCERARPSHR
jgi:hypothetical protein